MHAAVAAPEQHHQESIELLKELIGDLARQYDQPVGKPAIEVMVEPMLALSQLCARDGWTPEAAKTLEALKLLAEAHFAEDNQVQLQASSIDLRQQFEALRDAHGTFE